MSAYDDWDRSYRESTTSRERERARVYRDYGSDGRCAKCGATVTGRDMHAHSNWHLEIEKGIQVSKVLWCDPGDHAFKAGSPGTVSFTGQQTDENGVPQTVEMDVCGVHSGRIFATPVQKEASTVREVESAYRQSTIDGSFTD